MASARRKNQNWEKRRGNGKKGEKKTGQLPAGVLGKNILYLSAGTTEKGSKRLPERSEKLQQAAQNHLKILTNRQWCRKPDQQKKRAEAG